MASPEFAVVVTLQAAFLVHSYDRSVADYRKAHLESAAFVLAVASAVAYDEGTELE